MKSMVYLPLIVFSQLASGWHLPKQSMMAGNQLQQESQWFQEDYDFGGIVSLSNCSGSLVRFDDSRDNDLALVLTNGHCVKMMEPGTVFYDRTTTRKISFLDASGKTIGRAFTRKLLYATMTDTDMALYVLGKTYEQILESFGINALTISRERPMPGDEIHIISGYWKTGFSCEVEATIHQLKEARWVFRDSIRYSRPGCEVYGGTSGSPVILAGTKTVIAVNNTGNESGRRCTMNNPCEVDESGKMTYQKGYSYGQQIFWLYDCRNEDKETFEFDFDRTGCRLPKPTT